MAKRSSAPASTKSRNYHHGDLRQTLLNNAASMVAADGIEQLSLRKLAERSGVSRTAPYHHFKDKQELLCALAAQGFAELEALMDTTASRANPKNIKQVERYLKQFVRDYLHFAIEQPERYELMFGRTIWKAGHPSDELKRIAYHVFRRYADQLTVIIRSSNLPATSKPLRLAQASWATLHGLCRLLIDGIYINVEDMEEVSEEAVNLIAQTLAPGS